MRRLITALILASLPCFGQSDNCKVRFKVLQSDPHIPGGSMERLSEPQKKWLHGKEQKKYPTVCYDPARAAYAIIWSEEVHSRLVSDETDEPVKDENGNRIGTTTGHSTETVSKYVTYVSVMRIASDGHLEKPPIFFGQDHPPVWSRWGYGYSSSANGLEEAVKFLSSVAQ